MSRDRAADPRPRGTVTLEATIGTLDVQPLQAEFPLRTTVFGVEAVVISAEEYRRLRGAAMRLPFAEAKAAARAQRPRGRRPLPSTIERDPEVAKHLRSLFKAASTVEAARASCLERFGAERTPSRSRISRFRMKVREGA